MGKEAQNRDVVGSHKKPKFIKENKFAEGGHLLAGRWNKPRAVAQALSRPSFSKLRRLMEIGTGVVFHRLFTLSGTRWLEKKGECGLGSKIS